MFVPVKIDQIKSNQMSMSHSKTYVAAQHKSQSNSYFKFCLLNQFYENHRPVNPHNCFRNVLKAYHRIIRKFKKEMRITHKTELVKLSSNPFIRAVINIATEPTPVSAKLAQKD